MSPGERVLAREGRPSLGEVYEAERDGLVRFAAFVTGDVGAAAEVVHDAFADLQVAWESVQSPRAWLRSAVAKKSVSWVRRRTVARRYLHAGLRVDRDAQPSDISDRVAVRQAVARLSPQQRVVVFARFYLDMSEAQTAAGLGLRHGTVKSRLSRALRELEEALDER